MCHRQRMRAVDHHFALVDSPALQGMQETNPGPKLPTGAATGGA
jgi:hypothetical protein